jgi:hypothetical protein
MEFFGFLPEGFGLVAEFGDGFDDHADEEFGFAGFAFADGNAVAIGFAGWGIIGFAVVGSDAGGGSYELVDETTGDVGDGNFFEKFNDVFPEERGALLQIIRLPIGGLRWWIFGRHFLGILVFWYFFRVFG